MFKVTSLPASYGDCLWIEYGSLHAPHVVLIDAGPIVPDALKFRLEALAARGGSLELVVVTHIDADHIGGMLTLMEKDFYGVPVKDFWFNGYRHLPDTLEHFGPKQGEKLTGLLLTKGYPWNVAFNHGPIAVVEDQIITVYLEGGAKITLLSPDTAQLARLKVAWAKVCGDADLYADILPQQEARDDLEVYGVGVPDVVGLSDTKFKEDKAEANGSSIAFVFSYKGKQVLLAADAFPSRLLKTLSYLGDAPHAFDAVKLPHHGSENNVSTQLIEALASPLYIFSTDGAKFKHPSRQAVARVVRYGNRPLMAFNYKTEFNEIWDNPLLSAKYGSKTVYGEQDGFTVTLL